MNIVGAIDLDKLHKLEGHGVPGLDIDTPTPGVAPKSPSPERQH